MDNYMLHVQESVNLTIYLYAQIMGQQKMLYIHKFYVVKNINWLCIQLNFILFNLRHRDGWKLGTIYIYKNKLSVCVWVCLSGDVMFSTDEITDRDIGTQMTTGTPAHREYKWRHSKRKRPGQKECSISNQQSTGTQMTTGTQGV